MFIVFEGGDGSGKSTIVKLVVEALRELYPEIKTIKTREPGGTDLAEEIRKLLLGTQGEKPTSETELLLMAASRAQHYDRVIKPNRDHHIVICDRFVGSSIVYQGYGRGIPIERVLEVNKPMIEQPADLVFIFHVDPEVGQSRIKHRTGKDRLDLEGIEFHKRVSQGIKDLAKYEKYIGKVIDIDANKEVQEIKEEVMNHIIKRLSLA